MRTLDLQLGATPPFELPGGYRVTTGTEAPTPLYDEIAWAELRRDAQTLRIVGRRSAAWRFELTLDGVRMRFDETDTIRPPRFRAFVDEFLRAWDRETRRVSA